MSANTWEQLPRETSKAHKAFRMYLDLGPERSAVAVARQCGVNKSLVHRWSSRWRWTERVVEYDREQERKEFDAEIVARRAMRKRHASLALLALKLVAQKLPTIQPSEITTSEVAGLLGEACRVERLARGDPNGDDEVASVVINVQYRHPRVDDPPKPFAVNRHGSGGEQA